MYQKFYSDLDFHKKNIFNLILKDEKKFVRAMKIFSSLNKPMGLFPSINGIWKFFINLRINTMLKAFDLVKSQFFSLIN
jgi:hypothetical protein